FRRAKQEGAKAEEVKGWANLLTKAAADYGPRWQREMTFRIAERLAAAAKDYPAVAEEGGREAIKQAGEKGGAEAERAGPGLRGTGLKGVGRKEERSKTAAGVGELEEKGHKEAIKNLPFTPEKQPARKGKGRAVVVELFTGAQCPPCVAADMAFDGLEK